MQDLFRQFVLAGEDWGETEIVARAELRMSTSSRTQYVWMLKKDETFKT